MDNLLGELRVLLGAAEWPMLVDEWGYPLACGVVLILTLLARSLVMLLMVMPILAMGLLLPEPPWLRGMSILLGAMAVSHGFSARQRRVETERLLQAIAAQDAQLDAFMVALDRRNTLLDRRLSEARMAARDSFAPAAVPPARTAHPAGSPSGGAGGQV